MPNATARLVPRRNCAFRSIGASTAGSGTPTATTQGVPTTAAEAVSRSIPSASTCRKPCSPRLIPATSASTAPGPGSPSVPRSVARTRPLRVSISISRLPAGSVVRAQREGSRSTFRPATSRPRRLRPLVPNRDRDRQDGDLVSDRHERLGREGGPAARDRLAGVGARRDVHARGPGARARRAVLLQVVGVEEQRVEGRVRPEQRLEHLVPVGVPAAPERRHAADRGRGRDRVRHRVGDLVGGQAGDRLRVADRAPLGDPRVVARLQRARPPAAPGWRAGRGRAPGSRSSRSGGVGTAAFGRSIP